MLVEQGHDYLISVKGNQPKLMQQVQLALDGQIPKSQTVQLDTSHGRHIERSTKVFEAPPSLAQLWPKASSLVVVHRQGIREAEAFETDSFYLSSLALTAMEASVGVREHRDIENGLHWVRDVIFQEDGAPFKELAPALNWSVVRSIALNLFRANGYPSLTRAIRLLGNDLTALFSIVTMN